MPHELEPSDEAPKAARKVLMRWQFNLRTMLLVITAVGVCFAAINALDLFELVVLGWLVLLVAAHVVGNYCGTNHWRDPTQHESASEAPVAVLPPIATTHLGDRTVVGNRIWSLVAVSSFAGGVLGSAALAAVNWRHVDWANFSLGFVSAAVIGGFSGFLLATCFAMTRRAWREAASSVTFPAKR